MAENQRKMQGVVNSTWLHLALCLICAEKILGELWKQLSPELSKCCIILRMETKQSLKISWQIKCPKIQPRFSIRHHQINKRTVQAKSCSQKYKGHHTTRDKLYSTSTIRSGIACKMSRTTGDKNHKFWVRKSEVYGDPCPLIRTCQGHSGIRNSYLQAWVNI